MFISYHGDQHGVAEKSIFQACVIAFMCVIILVREYINRTDDISNKEEQTLCAKGMVLH